MALWRFTVAAVFFALTMLIVGTTPSGSGDGPGDAAVVLSIILTMIAFATALILAIGAMVFLRSASFKLRFDVISTPGVIGNACFFAGGWPIGEAIGIWVAYGLVKKGLVERASPR